MLENLIDDIFHIAPSLAGKVENHLTGHYPDEACGVFISSSSNEKDVTRVHFFDNIQDRLHEHEPDRYPRTARDAYNIDNSEWMSLERSLSDKGEKIISIFHSHIDCDAYFSDEDKLQAAPWGEPNIPGIVYLVISVRKCRIASLEMFRWDNSTADFRTILRKDL